MNKKIEIIRVVIATMLLTGAACINGCTAKFEELNTNPCAPTPDVMKGDNAHVRSLIYQMFAALCQTERNDSQAIDQLVGSDFGYMMAPVRTWDAGNHLFSQFNPPSTLCGQAFDKIMPQIYSNFFRIRELTGGQGVVYSWAQILRVAGSMHLSDIYGPIPYSKTTAESYSVEYDAMPDLYANMFKDLDEAIATLTNAVDSNQDLSSLAEVDQIYNGQFDKWVKFANTLKLRMAIRISGVSSDIDVQMKAKEAIDAGLMIDKTDSAWNPNIDVNGNAYWVVCYSYGNEMGEMNVSASIISYMVATGDPRLSIYATKQTYNTDRGNPDYVGCPNGIDLKSGIDADYQKFSKIQVNKTDPLLIMSAAEAWFLKAEACLTWPELGLGTAKEMYEQGVRVSLAERNANEGDYLTKSRICQMTYKDIKSGSSFSFTPHEVVSPVWLDGNDDENRERIVAQKWLANFPNGWETWADLRRNNTNRWKKFWIERTNVSGDRTALQRLKFPESEYLTNKANVEAAVATMNGGDQFSTKLWWANNNW